MGSTIKTQLWLIGGLGILGLVLVFGVWIMPGEVAGDRHDFDFGTPRKSVANIVMTVPSEKRDAYFKRMQDFAEGNELRMRIGRVSPDAEVFFIDLWRSDTMLTGGNVFDTPDFHFHLYIDPAKGGAASQAKVLVESLKRSMSSELGITVRDEK